MRSGRASSHLVSFASGHPDANVSWTLATPAGTTVATGTVTPSAGDVSISINISATHNTLAPGELIGARELSWSYTAGGQPRGGDVRYTLEAPIPFAVTHDGVRAKLGVTAEELPDDDIPLLAGYLEYRSLVSAAILDVLQSNTGYEQLLISDAIEASAGLKILPSLQIRLAQKESSGTNQFARANVDWKLLEDRLRSYVSAATASIAPIATAEIFLVTSTDVDAVTGA